MPFDLGITRNELKEAKERLAQGPPRYPSPTDFFLHHTNLVDSLVRKAFWKARSEVPSPSVCLLAVGSYGRRELAPYSDIDLLLLAPSQGGELAPLIEKILYPLWDLGLEVNCSSRSVSECLSLARSDLHVKTGLIDMRYLDGEYGLFDALFQLFGRSLLYQHVPDFAKALLEEIRERHRRYGDPQYVLEPHIKEIRGGLRDFQVGRWLVRAKHRTDRWEAVLFRDQVCEIEGAIQFLWTIRNEIHRLSGRRQDDLSFELQEKVAPLLGFEPGPRGIEEMMRRFHLSASRISNFTERALERILSEPPLGKRMFSSWRRRKIDSSFAWSRGQIDLADPSTFKKDPTRVMELFRRSQLLRAKIAPRTEDALIESLPWIDERFQSASVVNQTFLSILNHGEGVDDILNRMHKLGLLSRLIPEFGAIEGRVHYDLYHVHPVDVHSLLTVEELVKLRTGAYEKEFPLLSSLAKEVEPFGLLILCGLIHDIGKGEEGDHSLRGGDQAEKIAERMGLSEEEKRLLVFLVRRHLLMIETAFRRDLHDEGTIHRFAKEVEGSLRLKMLYLLSFADIRAVGPEAWTSWKDSLLMELFLRTVHFLEKGDVEGFFSTEERVLADLSEILSPQVFSQYREELPSRYLGCYPAAEIAHHIEMAARIEEEVLVVEWEKLDSRRARVTLCTRDRYGLFARIAGSMFLNRLNILGAQIHTWDNGIALDTFEVEDKTEEPERRIEGFKRDLEAVLSGRTTIKRVLMERKETPGLQPKVMPKVEAEVKINNHDSDFYTIVEVSGEDRLGILYEITQALTEHGCDIHFARVSTFGNRIVDVFYVQDEWGEKLEGKEKLDHLQRSLLSRLTGAAEEG
jgi:[protein-PII] uridylyltransferase